MILAAQYRIAFQAVLGDDLSSRLIAWYGNGYGGFSHVDCVLPDGRLIGARSDAIRPDGSANYIPPGVQIRPPEYERWKRRAVMVLPVNAETQHKWTSWLISQRRRQYDDGAILDFLLGRRDLHHCGRWICSAFAAESLEKCGIGKPLPVPASQVTPNSLCLMATQLGFSYHERAC